VRAGDVEGDTPRRRRFGDERLGVRNDAARWAVVEQSLANITKLI
jgi:hypothetical protein